MDPAKIRPGTKLATGQYNLFTSEVEPFPTDAPLPEEAWLFDPDFGLVLPGRSGGERSPGGAGNCAAFPVSERLQKPRGADPVSGSAVHGGTGCSEQAQRLKIPDLRLEVPKSEVQNGKMRNN